MTAIHLTDAQRDTFAACGLIVIDGEPCPQCDADFRSMVTRETHHCPGTVAPEGWRILTEPCDTCAGKGKLGKYPIFNGPGDFIDCPDCVGGRRVVTLTATCPRCNGTRRVKNFRATNVGKDTYSDCGACGGWRGSGKIDLGDFTIPALLPVVAYGDWEITARPLPCVTVDGYDQLVWMTDCGDPEGAYGEPLVLDPLPRPGQFIARPEAVA